MGRSRTSQLLVLAAILLMVAWVYRGSAVTALMRWTGAPMVNGTGMLTLTGKPGRVVSMLAYPSQGGQLNSSPVAAFHVLVLFPADSLTEQGGNSVMEGASASYRQVWRVWSGTPGHERAVQRTFTTRYSGLRQSVRLGDQRYSLKDGNLFVVRYDERGHMSVSQLRQTLRDADAFNAMTAFEMLLPEDEAVQSLQRWEGKRSCPRRQAAQPRGAST